MTSTATTTRNLQEVRPLPALDVAAAKQGAREAVESHFSDTMTLEERLTVATSLAETLTREYDRVRAARDAAAWTMEAMLEAERAVTGHRSRRYGSINDAMGVGRNRWKSIRDRFKDAAIKPAPTPDAPTRLPELSARTKQLEAQRQHALTIRNEATVALRAEESSLSNAQIARMIHRDPSRVSRLTSGAH